MVGHGVGALDGLGILGGEGEQVHPLPVLEELLLNLEILGKVDLVGGHLDLDVTAGAVVEFLALRHAQHELADEGGDAVVGDHLALPLVDGEYLVRHLHLQVVAHLDLAAQPPVLLGVAEIDVLLLGRQDVAAARHYLTAAHPAGTAAAARRRQHDPAARQRIEQGAAGIGLDRPRLVAIDGDLDLALRAQPGLGDQQGDREKADHRREYDNASQYLQHVAPLPTVECRKTP